MRCPSGRTSGHTGGSEVFSIGCVCPLLHNIGKLKQAVATRSGSIRLTRGEWLDALMRSIDQTGKSANPLTVWPTGDSVEIDGEELPIFAAHVRLRRY